MPDGADEGRGGQQPNPGNCPQSHHDGVGVGQGAQFPFQAGNPSLNRPHFLVDAREHLPQMPRQHGGRLVEQHRQGPQRRTGPRRQQQPLFPQEPA